MGSSEDWDYAEQGRHFHMTCSDYDPHHHISLSCGLCDEQDLHCGSCFYDDDPFPFRDICHAQICPYFYYDFYAENLCPLAEGYGS